MKATSVHLIRSGGIITAEGPMGECGRGYTTCELTGDAGRSSGLVDGEGRGSGEDDYFGHASFSGTHLREGDSIYNAHSR